MRRVAVTRNTISGGVLGADQKISRKKALRVETINNAYLTFEERTKGSIEPGNRFKGAAPRFVRAYDPGNAAEVLTPCFQCFMTGLNLAHRDQP